MATRSQAGAGGPRRHFTNHPRPLASLVAPTFSKGRFGLGQRCRRARYPSQRGTSAAARAAARHATAPAHRCNVGRAARRGTFEHWVAVGAPNVASRLLARTFPRGLHQERSTEGHAVPTSKDRKWLSQSMRQCRSVPPRRARSFPESRQNQDELRPQTPRGGARPTNGTGFRTGSKCTT
jgi:hypothetical protein